MRKIDINKRILTEIDNYKTSDNVKIFLKEIIEAELYNEVGYKYNEEYKKKIESINNKMDDN
jgi:hypothetical protein